MHNLAFDKFERKKETSLKLTKGVIGENEWIEIDGPTPDNFTRDVELQLSLEAFVATLPPGDGEVARLWLLDGLEIDEIAERLDKKPNALYQARSRINVRLREWLES